MVEKKAIGKEEKQISKEEQLRTTEETSISEHPVPDADSNKPPKENFPLVGIGASAGGLAAFEAFFSAMPQTPSPYRIFYPITS
jgi:two-component system, chemotaxis family, CheB/CheR fusion protein